MRRQREFDMFKENDEKQRYKSFTDLRWSSGEVKKLVGRYAQFFATDVEQKRGGTVAPFATGYNLS